MSSHKKKKFDKTKTWALVPRPDPKGGVASPFIGLTGFQKLQAFMNGDREYRFNKSGIAGQDSIEPVPELITLASEKVITNKRNAWIVLGTDRTDAPLSGYGGKGEPQVAAIDLVCGRMGSYVRDVDKFGEPIEVNPDFTLDAARIYISQKADIDEYFDLPDGKVGNPIAASAIAFKADEIRMISPGGIKIITGQDARNARGHRVNEPTEDGKGIKGIDLIAGPGENPDCQPLIKGNNLVSCLGTVDTELPQSMQGPPGLASQINALRGILHSFVLYQKEFNQAVMNHQHISGWQILPNYWTRSMFSEMLMSAGAKNITQLTAQTEMSLVAHASNMSLWEANYLSPGFEKYVCSDHNTTN